MSSKNADLKMAVEICLSLISFVTCSCADARVQSLSVLVLWNRSVWYDDSGCLTGEITFFDV